MLCLLGLQLEIVVKCKSSGVARLLSMCVRISRFLAIESSVGVPHWSHRSVGELWEHDLHLHSNNAIRTTSCCGNQAKICTFSLVIASQGIP